MGMNSLPDVKDDRKNMQYMIQNMINIPYANIFEVPEATSDQLDDVTNKVKVNV